MEAQRVNRAPDVACSRSMQASILDAQLETIPAHLVGECLFPGLGKRDVMDLFDQVWSAFEIETQKSDDLWAAERSLVDVKKQRAGEGRIFSGEDALISRSNAGSFVVAGSNFERSKRVFIQDVVCVAKVTQS